MIYLPGTIFYTAPQNARIINATKLLGLPTNQRFELARTYSNPESEPGKQVCYDVVSTETGKRHTLYFESVKAGEKVIAIMRGEQIVDDEDPEARKRVNYDDKMSMLNKQPTGPTRDSGGTSDFNNRQDIWI